jgi:hypothetical protein
MTSAEMSLSRMATQAGRPGAQQGWRGWPYQQDHQDQHHEVDRRSLSIIQGPTLMVPRQGKRLPAAADLATYWVMMKSTVMNWAAMVVRIR